MKRDFCVKNVGVGVLLFAYVINLRISHVGDEGIAPTQGHGTTRRGDALIALVHDKTPIGAP